MDSLLGLTIPNLRVVLNMQPLGLDTEMQHEEERFDKLVSNIDPEHPSLQSEVGLDKHRDRMRLLMSNKVLPFKAQLIVIACERSPDKLDERMEALRVALGKTGCQPFQPSFLHSFVQLLGERSRADHNQLRQCRHQKPHPVRCLSNPRPR